jgi:hypothetical protein
MNRSPSHSALPLVTVQLRRQVSKPRQHRVSMLESLDGCGRRAVHSSTTWHNEREYHSSAALAAIPNADEQRIEINDRVDT